VEGWADVVNTGWEFDILQQGPQLLLPGILPRKLDVQETVETASDEGSRKFVQLWQVELELFIERDVHVRSFDCLPVRFFAALLHVLALAIVDDTLLTFGNRCLWVLV
jgi:hypothetical protein